MSLRKEIILKPNPKKICKLAIRAWLADYASQSDSDYELNEQKQQKWLTLAEYCQSLEDEYDCQILRYCVEPRMKQGAIEVMFRGEWAVGEKPDSMLKFIGALECCDGLNIATTPADDDWIVVTFFVNDLWLRKQQ